MKTIFSTKKLSVAIEDRPLFLESIEVNHINLSEYSNPIVTAFIRDMMLVLTDKPMSVNEVTDKIIASNARIQDKALCAYRLGAYYGSTFTTKEDLASYLKLMPEGKATDMLNHLITKVPIDINNEEKSFLYAMREMGIVTSAYQKYFM